MWGLKMKLLYNKVSSTPYGKCNSISSRSVYIFLPLIWALFSVAFASCFLKNCYKGNIIYFLIHLNLISKFLKEVVSFFLSKCTFFYYYFHAFILDNLPLIFLMLFRRTDWKLLEEQCQSIDLLWVCWSFL